MRNNYSIFYETGKRVKNFRCINNYSGLQVAEYLMITAQAYYKYERGESIPPHDNLRALADLYNVDIEDIYPIEDYEDSPLSFCKKIIEMMLKSIVI